MTPDCCPPPRSQSPALDAPQTTRPAPAPAPDGMVYLEGGSFLMGTESTDGFPDDGEGPIREVQVDPYLIDAAPVTNREFGRFVRATGYKTESERFGWSFVFQLLVPGRLLRSNPQRVNEVPWWLAINGASWRHPRGARFKCPQASRSSGGAGFLERRPRITAAGPASACRPRPEWEFTARGGLVQAIYPWGDELTPGGMHMANIWQGKFPDLNTRDDGYLGTCPVKTFPSNGFGIYGIAGNVWEWCQDWFSPNYHLTASPVNPRGPAEGSARVMRGGSIPVPRTPIAIVTGWRRAIAIPPIPALATSDSAAPRIPKYPQRPPADGRTGDARLIESQLAVATVVG